MSVATQAAATESPTDTTAATGSPTAALPLVPTQYVGLVTRTIAFIVDVIIVDLVTIIVAGSAALVISFFHISNHAETILKLIAAGLALLWTVGYFVGFWAARGQTPGNRVMQIRVVTTGGQRVKPTRGVLRFVGLVVAALPLFAGYLLIPFDRKCRGLQDRIAGTVVVEAPDLSILRIRRDRQRSAYEAARAAAAFSGSPPEAGAPLADGAEPADGAGLVTDARAESISVTR